MYSAHDPSSSAADSDSDVEGDDDVQETYVDNFVPLALEKQKLLGFFPQSQCVVLRRTNASKALKYASIDALNERLEDADFVRDVYDRFAYMYVYERSKAVPRVWPHNLQTLDVRFSLCSHANLPEFPPLLRSVSFLKCPLIEHFDVPELCRACPLIEDIVLYGCAVQTLHALTPDTDAQNGVDVERAPPCTPDARENDALELRLIDASYCPVHSIDLRLLPMSLTSLYVQGNTRDDTGLPIVVNLDGIARDRPNLYVYTDDAPPLSSHRAPPRLLAAAPARPPPPSPGMPAYRGIWEDSHNVHTRGIQDSTNVSMDALNRAFVNALPAAAQQSGVAIADWTDGGIWLRESKDALLRLYSRPRPPAGAQKRRTDNERGEGETNAADQTRDLHPPSSTTWHRLFSSCTPSLMSPPFLSRTRRSGRRDNTEEIEKEEEAAATERERTADNQQRHWERERLDAVLSRFTDDTFAHSVYALTIRELLMRVWTVICVHPSRDDLTRVLAEELADGSPWCFTGRFTRLVNVLSGFLEGVSVGISRREQLSNRLAVLWKRVDVVTDESDAMKKCVEKPSKCGAERVDAKRAFTEACRETKECLAEEGDEYTLRENDDCTKDGGLRAPAWETVLPWVSPFADTADLTEDEARLLYETNEDE